MTEECAKIQRKVSSLVLSLHPSRSKSMTSTSKADAKIAKAITIKTDMEGIEIKVNVTSGHYPPSACFLTPGTYTFMM